MDSDVHTRPLLSSDVHHMINARPRHFAKVHPEARHLYAQARRQQVALQVREKRHVQQAMLIRVIKAKDTSGVVTSSRSLRSNNVFYQDRRWRSDTSSTYRIAKAVAGRVLVDSSVASSLNPFAFHREARGGQLYLSGFA